MLAQSLSSSSSPNMPEKKPGTAFSENNPLSIATTGRSKVARAPLPRGVAMEKSRRSKRKGEEGGGRGERRAARKTRWVELSSNQQSSLVPAWKADKYQSCQEGATPVVGGFIREGQLYAVVTTASRLELGESCVCTCCAVSFGLHVY